MEENRQDQDLKQTEVNKETVSIPVSRTGHTWIGDRDEIRPDLQERPVTRMTLTDSDVRSTRIAERERKPYRGFITDEEVKFAEAAAEVDRRALAESRAAREEMMQTRVYSGFGSGFEDDRSEEPAEESKPVKRRAGRKFNVRIADSRKFRRLIALAAVFALLVLFEISFAVMKAQTASLPGRTQEIRTQTEAITAENEALKSAADEIGEYDQVKELRDSWQRIKDRLAE